MKNISLESITKGIYILEIYATNEFRTSIKKFKNIIFPQGYYYYVGSAQKGYTARIKRHLAAKKKIHWHIDHVTSVKSNKITNIYCIENAGRDVEIKLADQLMTKLNCHVIAEKFGSSDSPESLTHLVYRQLPLKDSKLKSICKTLQVAEII